MSSSPPIGGRNDMSHALPPIYIGCICIPIPLQSSRGADRIPLQSMCTITALAIWWPGNQTAYKPS